MRWRCKLHVEDSTERKPKTEDARPGPSLAHLDPLRKHENEKGMDGSLLNPTGIGTKRVQRCDDVEKPNGELKKGSKCTLWIHCSGEKVPGHGTRQFAPRTKNSGLTKSDVTRERRFFLSNNSMKCKQNPDGEIWLGETENAKTTMCGTTRRQIPSFGGGR